MDLLSIQEASQLLGVSRDTVRRWAAAGRFHSYRKLGKGLWLYLDRKEVEALKESPVVPARAPEPTQAARPKTKRKRGR